VSFDVAQKFNCSTSPHQEEEEEGKKIVCVPTNYYVTCGTLTQGNKCVLREI
jgi:hypothetical protein